MQKKSTWINILRIVGILLAVMAFGDLFVRGSFFWMLKPFRTIRPQPLSIVSLYAFFWSILPWGQIAALLIFYNRIKLPAQVGLLFLGLRGFWDTWFWAIEKSIPSPSYAFIYFYDPALQEIGGVWGRNVVLLTITLFFHALVITMLVLLIKRGRRYFKASPYFL